jgi:hypothetical protein
MTVADPISDLNVFMAAISGVLPTLGAFFIVFLVIMFLAMLMSLVLWVLMLIDLINRDFPKKDDKILWALLLLFTQSIGALLYYFLVKSKDKKK